MNSDKTKKKWSVTNEFYDHNHFCINPIILFYYIFISFAISKLALISLKIDSR